MLGVQRGTVRLVPYSPEWERQFEEEERLLRAAIGDHVIDIQHVGSTAIPGLDAKPIIDIAVAVRRLGEAEKYVEPLDCLGYEFRREAGVPGRYLFAKGNPRTHHVHIVEWNSELWQNYLLFRGCLRQHEGVAREYATIKRELARKFETDRGAYTAAKAAFIDSVLKRAKSDLCT